MNGKVQKLAIEAAKGNFKSVYLTITNKEVIFNNVDAAKIVVECCRIFVAEESPNINEEDLLLVLKTCLQFINNISDDTAVRYLQSLSWILNYFVKKKNYSVMSQMENILLPTFINPFKSTEIIKMYAALSNHTHRAIVTLSEELSDRNELYIKLCMLTLRLYFIHSSTAVSLANMVYSISKNRNVSEVIVNTQHSYFLQVLQLILEQRLDNKFKDPNDLYIASVKILEVIVVNYLKRREFNKVRECIDIAISRTSQIYKTKQQSELFKILDFVSQCVIELTDNQDGCGLFINNVKSCYEQLKYFCENYGLTTEIQKTSHLFYLILRELVCYYESVTSSIWSMWITEDTVINIYKLLGAVGHIASKSTFQCRSCTSGCNIKQNLYLATLITSSTGSLSKISLAKGMNFSIDLSRQTLHYLKICCTLVTDMKNQECLNWKSAWNIVGITIYNIASKLYHLKHVECEKYFILLIQTCIKLEGITGASILEVNVFDISFSCLVQIYTEIQRFQEALMYAAMQILFIPNSNASKQWASIKYKERQSDDPPQQLTVLCVLEKNKDVIEDLYPKLNINLDDSTKINVLLYELKQYLLVWPSSGAMKAAIKKLYEVADLFTVTKALIPMWIKTLVFSHDDIIPLLDEMFKKFKHNSEEGSTDRKIERQLYSASLYTVRYFTQTTIIKQKIAENINNTVSPTKTPLPQHEIPIHPNDECDLVPSYINLNLDECLRRTKLLNKALTLFDNSIITSPSSYIEDILRQCDIVTFIAMIGSEFHLHCDMLQATRAWFICTRIAKLIKNDLCWLHYVSLILGVSDMNSDIIKELLIESEHIIRELNGRDELIVWKTLIIFYINKSKMLLYNQLIEAGYEEYQKAAKLFDKLDKKDDLFLLKIQLELLHVRYMQLPCYFKIEDHHRNSLVTFSRILSKITVYMKSRGSIESSAHSIFFEICQELVHMYRWLSLPREVRCYARDTVVDAQILALPLRTAYFLIYLAQADLQSIRLDDCQIKLNGLSDILCLGSKNVTALQNENSPKSCPIRIHEDVLEITESFAEIMLDCTSYAGKQELLGSPVFPIQPFKLPSFLKHVDNCDCFYCTSVEYQNLILMYINLEAKLHVHRNNITAAQACFGGALRVFKRISTRNDQFKAYVRNLLSSYPFCDFKDLLCQSYCEVLLSYGNFLLRLNNTNESEKIHKKLINIISERKYENIYLYNEANFNYMMTILNKCCENEKEKQNNVLGDTELTAGNNEDAKTPENHLKVVFPAQYSPGYYSPPKPPLRKIKFKLSDEKAKKDKITIFTSPSNSGNNSDDEIKTREKLKSLLLKKSQPASYTTPAPKTIQRNKPIFSLASPPEVSSSTTDNDSSMQASLNVIPQSPNAYTPKSIKASKYLQSRTKTLTKRLKKATVEEDIVKDFNDANIKSNSDMTGVKNNVRKNLMSELCAPDDDKKSTNKKKMPKQNSRSNGKENTTGRVTRAKAKKCNKL